MIVPGIALAGRRLYEIARRRLWAYVQLSVGTQIRFG